jgi:hypothetical protein
MMNNNGREPFSLFVGDSQGDALDRHLEKTLYGDDAVFGADVFQKLVSLEPGDETNRAAIEKFGIDMATLNAVLAHNRSGEKSMPAEEWEKTVKKLLGQVSTAVGVEKKSLENIVLSRQAKVVSGMANTFLSMAPSDKKK